MSVRVIARIRPLLKSELDKDIITTAVSAGIEQDSQPTVVRIPNPKNESESFSFQFNSVYDQNVSQEDIFDNEVSPTIKHLFNGLDVTLFAYGVTGTGKTHTMRGGKSLADRGVIPRLLSGIYRRVRKLEKDTQGGAAVSITMSYYEIYNDRVFDLFEPPEKRTPTGLQLRDNGGKTVVVGLTERPCESVKEFGKLYDEANINRSTSATKLNAHSSRSHAILCVKIAVTTGEKTIFSSASAIDLAGSEDNRRTDNNKERLVESASINKSLFVLAQCVEAISKKQNRIPYRESKMTRILSLGQNRGLTIMILNLAPVRSYHLDTLSSLNFANRTKKIEVREVENEPIYKQFPRPVALGTVPTVTGTSIQRQPLRPLGATVHNATINAIGHQPTAKGKPAKEFSVYSDRSKHLQSNQIKRSSPLKRPSDGVLGNTRPSKMLRPSLASKQPNISKETIEDMVEKKVNEILAARALDQPSVVPPSNISDEVRRRLELLEQKIDGHDDDRAEGLTYLLMAKQHHVRGEESSSLKMYELAKQFFPDNAKLDGKIQKLRMKLQEKRTAPQSTESQLQKTAKLITEPIKAQQSTKVADEWKADPYSQETSFVPDADDDDDNYHSEDGFRYRTKTKKGPNPKTLQVTATLDAHSTHTPRTKQLLDVVNTRDVSLIRFLQGVGAKKAESIVEQMWFDDIVIDNLGQLEMMKGVGSKTVAKMRFGL